MASIDDMISALDEELEDINDAEISAAQEGLRPGDYNLATKARQVRKEKNLIQESERREQEQIQKMKLSKETGPLGKNLISISTKQEPGTDVYAYALAKKQNEDLFERTYKSGAQYKVSEMGRQVGELYETEKVYDAQQGKMVPKYAQVSTGVGAFVDPKANEFKSYKGNFPVEAEMLKDIPSLRKKYAELPFKEVRQVEDKGHLVNGVPSMYLEPVYEEVDIIKAAPKESEFKGELDYTQKHEKALDKHFKKAGMVDWRDRLKGDPSWQKIYDIKN